MTGRRTALLMAAKALVAGAAFGLQPAVAGYNIFTGAYTVSQAELQERIETRFPQQMAYPPLFDLVVSRPRLRLDAASARAAVTVDVRVRSPLAAQPINGWIAISSRFAYDAATRSVRLVAPAADRIEFQGLSRNDAQQLQLIGQAVAQQALQGWPLHTFRQEELRFGNRTFTPGDITVGDGEITIKLD